MNRKTISLLVFVGIFFAVNNVYGFQGYFTPRISVSEEYSDNIYLSSRFKEHDYLTSITPGFTLDFPGQRGGATISYDPSFVFYKKETDNNTIRQSAQFSLWNNLWKNTRLEFNNSYLRTEDPLEDEDFFLETGESLRDPDHTVRQSREPYYINTASLNLTHQFGAADFFRMGYVFGLRQNDNPTEDDNKSHSPSIGLTYWFLPDMAVETNLAYTKAEYSGSDDPSDDSKEWKAGFKLIKRFSRHLEGFINYNHTIMDYKGDEEDYQVFDPSIGINYAISDDTRLNIGIGYFIQNRENSDGDSGLSLTGDLGKTWDFKRGSIDLTGVIGYDEANLGAENLGFEKYYQVKGSAEYSFTQRLSANINYSFRRDKYVDTDENRIDRTSRFGTGFRYAPTRWMFFSLDYSYNTVTSTDREDEYDENRVIFSISLSPKKPWRLGG
ncbi:MAG: outer membrane beta-barrel protein [Desulfosarcina sp.]|nr:outer membrane beta-barrel protein [Desulfobacterales bacterium]